jgi:Fe-S-cluster containining protein
MQNSRRTPTDSTKRTAKRGALSKTAAPAQRPMVSCTDCGKCCTYVAIEIDGPTSLKNATMALWYLYHEGVSLYREADGDWVVQFETRCRHLGADNRCGVYAVRPHICRDFDEKFCEVNTGDDGQTFATPADFLEYVRVHRPKIHAKLADGYARREDLAPQVVTRRRLPIAATSSPLS